jgi:hypothetical protein
VFITAKELKINLSVQEVYFILKALNQSGLADEIQDSLFQGDSIESTLNVIIDDKRGIRYGKRK